MALTPEQIETVREIIALGSYSATQTLLSALNAAQEAATIADIAEWDPVKNKFSKLAGGRLGFYSDKEPKRLALRNRVRIRLGLHPLTDETTLDAGTGGFYASHPADDEGGCGR